MTILELMQKKSLLKQLFYYIMKYSKYFKYLNILKQI